ncbi:PREDICTED: metabotropic glutamate receptor 2-like [Priapulus caudatus]|uniref:Metabotropic glutamate receptor 2-like n=1 Tax=Priapulus caudatus TaxID=37621 RepID=A0ABM1EMS2_PRICU|nr:PREDICTED: metabotropic glutamate receptor 2-like [Priapulus caudatus]
MALRYASKVNVAEQRRHQRLNLMSQAPTRETISSLEFLKCLRRFRADARSLHSPYESAPLEWASVAQAPSRSGEELLHGGATAASRLLQVTAQGFSPLNIFRFSPGFGIDGCLVAGGTVTCDEWAPFEQCDQPWFREYWDLVTNCSDTSGTCANYSMLGEQAPGWLPPMPVYYGLYTATYAFAHALDALVREQCFNLSSASDLASCVRGPLLLKYVRNVTFEAYPGHYIRFDSNGDIIPRYQVYTFRRGATGRFEHVPVGVWEDNTLSLNESLIPWARVGSVPESVCSKPCPPRHYVIQLDPSCCWKCHPCGENEYLLANRTNCVACPPLHWPESGNGSAICRRIPPRYPSWSDKAVVVVMVIVLLGETLTLVVMATFVRHRRAKLIKACSRELSFIAGIGVVLSFGVAMVMLAKPTTTVCLAKQVAFPLCFTTIYAPMLVRANRIHRIFTKAKHSAASPPCVSPLSQVIITIGVIAVQVISD